MWATLVLATALLPQAWIASPVIQHGEVYTAFSLANQTAEYSGEALIFQAADVDVYFLERGEIRAWRTFHLAPAEAVYFHTGDILGEEDFSGVVIFLTRDKVTGSVYVLGAAIPLTAELERIE